MDDNLPRVRVTYQNKKHLLCKYNHFTGELEIKVPLGRSSDGGEVWAIPLRELISYGARNVISDDPVWEFEAKLINGNGTKLVE